MGIPHKAFYCKRIIFTLSVFFAFQLYASEALAQNSLFTVEDITVDVTAENSVEAQDQAFDQAQRDAFLALAKRMVSEGQTQNVKIPDPITLSTMIKDYEVTNEKLSAVRYVGTYTFRFRESAVSRLFSSSGVTYTETRSKTLLVLPILQRSNKKTIWAEDNLWLQAWSRNTFSSTLVPVEVPIGDLADIADINDQNPLRYERVSLNRMLNRYKAKEAAIMIAIPDPAFAAQRSHDDIAQGQLRVSIYRTDRARAEPVQDLFLKAKNGETVRNLYDRGVQSGYKALQKDWKRKTSHSAAQAKGYTVRVPLQNLTQWVQIRQSLARVSGLNTITVLSMKPVEAHVGFIFRGDENRLRSALSSASLQLGDRQTREDKAVIYELFQGNRSSDFYTPSNAQSGSFSQTTQTF